jgi:hypothetical protein
MFSAVTSNVMTLERPLGLLQLLQVQPLTRRKSILLKDAPVATTASTLRVAGNVSPVVLMENTYGLLKVVLLKRGNVSVPGVAATPWA